MNVLKSHLRITIQTLLQAGKSQREIERITGVDRKTIRRYAQVANGTSSPGVATGFSAGKAADTGGSKSPTPATGATTEAGPLGL